MGVSFIFDKNSRKPRGVSFIFDKNSRDSRGVSTVFVHGGTVKPVAMRLTSEKKVKCVAVKK